MQIYVYIKDTLNALLAQEDTDNDKKITSEDNGPKQFTVSLQNGDDYVVKGTYYLSNLLQELILSEEEGNEYARIPISKIEEAPVNRISRMIRDYYWDGLTRSMDKAGIRELLRDTKNETLEGDQLKVYVPFGDTIAQKFYKDLSNEMPIEMIRLPEDITPEYVRTLNDKTGILSLHLSEENGSIIGSPFVVPGGRFNEMYGWDSYFESIGLLLDNRVDLARGMADNFQYEINHYGKILNANRSYYLTRTQPPFYSSLISEVFEKTQDKSWLKSHLQTAIIEYETVWMKAGERLTSQGLNRYLAQGIGKPPEAEAGHFSHVFEPYARASDMDAGTYEHLYSERKILNDELDKYFIHDRSVRESGHDTSYRLEGICAHILPVELNAFLYKYEIDFAQLIATVFNDKFTLGERSYDSGYWKQKADERKKLMNELMWNAESGLYFDYNIKEKKQNRFVSATLFTPLWSGMASAEQAQLCVEQGIALLKEKGGIASCTEESRGPISEHRPQKQWDYPYGWAPHQMMIWKGLKQYGFEVELQELVYRWLFMITKNAVDYNGTIPEKYDVVLATHKVFAEYGNVGTEFQYITREGFGWMNASFQYGVTFLSEENIEQLNKLTPPEELFNQ